MLQRWWSRPSGGVRLEGVTVRSGTVFQSGFYLGDTGRLQFYAQLLTGIAELGERIFFDFFDLFPFIFKDRPIIRVEHMRDPMLC